VLIIDNSTLILLITFISFLITILSFMHRNRSTPFIYVFYPLSNFLFSLGLVSLIVQAFTDSGINIFVGNTLFTISFLLVGYVVASLFALKISKILYGILLAFHFILFFYYTFIYFNTFARVIVISAEILVLTGYFSFVTMMYYLKKKKNLALLISLNFFFLFGVNILRVVISYSTRIHLDSIVSQDPATSILLIGLALFFITWNYFTFLALLMHSEEKLQASLSSLSLAQDDLNLMHNIYTSNPNDVTLQEMCKTIFRILKQRFHFMHAGIYQYNADERLLHLISQTGLEKRLEEKIEKLDVHNTITGIAVRENRFISSEINESLESDFRTLLIEMGFKNITAFPLSTGSKVFGAIVIVHTENFEMTNEFINVFISIVHQFAIILSNYNLYDSIAHSEHKYRTFFNLAKDAIFIHTINGAFLDVNLEACRRMQYSRLELLSKGIQDIDSPESSENAPDIIDTIIKTGSASFETVHIKKDGTKIPTWINATTIDFDGKQAIMSVARDITERKNTEEKLHQLATTDPLTNAINRRPFIKELKTFFTLFRRHGTSLSIFMVDIDDFKNINDLYGHDAGDLVLVHLVETAHETFRESDLFARYGGEEFIGCFYETASLEALQSLERFMERIRRAVIYSSKGPVMFTVSIGISTAEPGDESYEAVIKKADDALYEAKRMGKDKIIIY
jgi:diguanylate cyclase (GGDEF)-like protein/PAS domain S-box-containing protein